MPEKYNSEYEGVEPIPEVPLSTLPEKRISKGEMIARRVGRGLLTLLMARSAVSATASTATAHMSPSTNYEYRAADSRLESILGTPERLVAAQYLSGSLSYGELNGGKLDAVSSGLYAKMTGVAVPDGYGLTPEDYRLLIAIEMSTHGAMVDASNKFAQYAGQYYVSNPNAYDSRTRCWGSDALEDFRNYLGGISIVMQADGTRIDAFNGAIGYIFQDITNIQQTNQRLREVMNLIMATQANLEKMIFAEKFAGIKFSPHDALLDRRAGVDELRSALIQIDKGNNTRTVRTLLTDFSTNNVVWISPVGPEDGGHYDFFDNAGNLVLQGRFDTSKGITHYYDIGSGKTDPLASIMSLGVRAPGYERTAAGEFAQDKSWFRRLIDAFHIDVGINAGVGIGVQYGGGRMPTGWGASGVQWNQVDWQYQDIQWDYRSHGMVWDNVWHSTAYDRQQNRAEKSQYNAGNRGVAGTGYANKVFTEPNRNRANAGKEPVRVTGNTPNMGGKGFSNSPNVQRQKVTWVNR